MLFIFWPWWVSIAAHGHSLVTESGGCSSSSCTGSHCSGSLVVEHRLWGVQASAVVAHGLSCSVARDIFPDWGWQPCAGRRFFITGPWGGPQRSHSFPSFTMVSRAKQLYSCLNTFEWASLKAWNILPPLYKVLLIFQHVARCHSLFLLGRWKWKALTLYSPWNSPGQNTGVGSLSLLQRIFPPQGSNPGLWHCRQILYQLSHKGSPVGR